jgi:hypothetical protein
MNEFNPQNYVQPIFTFCLKRRIFSRPFYQSLSVHYLSPVGCMVNDQFKQIIPHTYFYV